METASRRTFCKLAGMAAAGVAATAAGKPALADEGAHLVDWVDVSFSKEAEVLIIGAGPGGMLCAYETATAGMTTIVADKNHYTGGVARVSAGVQNYFGSQYGKEMRGAATYDEMTETMEAFHNKKIHPDIAERISFYTGKVQDLIGYDFGYEWDPAYPEPELSGYWLPKGGLGETWEMMDVIQENVEAAGAELLLSEKCTSLIQNADDEVIGARFVNCDTGAVTDIKASYVVLSTGGYISNQTYVAEYLPDWVSIGCSTVGSDGDGFGLARAVGGYVEGTKYLNMNSHVEAIFVAQMFGPSISVLPNGRRFYNETACHSAATGALALGNLTWWSIWDDQLDQGPQRSIISTGDDTRVVANSVEELAELTSIPLAELQKTFDEYAEMCEKQEDPAFGRTLFLTELKPPYYALNNRVVRYKSIGGMGVNIDSQMIDSDGNPIPHVFCAGLMGLFDYSADLVPSMASGMFCGDCIARIAGKISG